MADLVGDAVRDIPYYGLMEAKGWWKRLYYITNWLHWRKRL
jgi:hypothetical protein